MVPRDAALSADRGACRSVGRVLALVIVLLVTNLVTALAAGAAGCARARRTRTRWTCSRRRGRPGVSERNRRLITLEVLNPLELASARAVGGFAVSPAPSRPG